MYIETSVKTLATDRAKYTWEVKCDGHVKATGQSIDYQSAFLVISQTIKKIFDDEYMGFVGEAMLAQPAKPLELTPEQEKAWSAEVVDMLLTDDPEQHKKAAMAVSDYISLKPYSFAHTIFISDAHLTDPVEFEHSVIEDMTTCPVTKGKHEWDLTNLRIEGGDNGQYLDVNCKHCQYPGTLGRVEDLEKQITW